MTVPRKPWKLCPPESEPHQCGGGSHDDFVWLLATADTGADGKATNLQVRKPGKGKPRGAKPGPLQAPATKTLASCTPGVSGRGTSSQHPWLALSYETKDTCSDDGRTVQGTLGVGQMWGEQPLNSGLWVQGQLQRNKDEKATKAGRGHVARQELVRVERGQATASARSDHPPPFGHPNALHSGAM